MRDSERERAREKVLIIPKFHELANEHIDFLISELKNKSDTKEVISTAWTEGFLDGVTFQKNTDWNFKGGERMRDSKREKEILKIISDTNTVIDAMFHEINLIVERRYETLDVIQTVGDDFGIMIRAIVHSKEQLEDVQKNVQKVNFLDMVDKPEETATESTPF